MMSNADLFINMPFGYICQPVEWKMNLIRTELNIFVHPDISYYMISIWFSVGGYYGEQATLFIPSHVGNPSFFFS